MSTHNSLEHLHNSYIYLAQIGWQENVAEGGPVQCFRDMHVIHYVSRGTILLEIENASYEVKSGEAFYIPPATLAQYRAISDDQCEYYYFAFAGMFSDEIISNTVFKNGNFVSEIKDAEQLVSIIKDASSKIKVQPYVHYYGIEQLFKILPFFTKRSDLNLSKAKTRYFSVCKDYLQGHFSENIKISELAEQLNISSNYLFRIFKECANMSPHEYLTNIRMQHAKEYLINTDLSTNEIGELVGYINYTTFYTMFNNKMLMSPHEYRLLQRNRNLDVESNSATTIRMFRDMNDCMRMDAFAIGSLSLSDDVHYNGEQLKETYFKKVKFKELEYDCMAYVFEDKVDAKNYFERVAGTSARNEEFDFKIRESSGNSMLCVWNNNQVYKWQGGNLLDFNEFRHNMNRFYHVILLN